MRLDVLKIEKVLGHEIKWSRLDFGFNSGHYPFEIFYFQFSTEDWEAKRPLVRPRCKDSTVKLRERFRIHGSKCYEKAQYLILADSSIRTK